MSKKLSAKLKRSPANKPKRGGNPDNIKPFQFKPGKSGNPGGRPKKQPLTEALEELLEADPKVARQIALAMCRAARKGNVKAFNSVADRVEGKVKQVVALTGEEGAEPIRIADARNKLMDKLTS